MLLVLSLRELLPLCYRFRLASGRGKGTAEMWAYSFS